MFLMITSWSNVLPYLLEAPFRHFFQSVIMLWKIWRLIWEKVLKIIRLLYTTKAHGCDEISVSMIKICDHSCDYMAPGKPETFKNAGQDNVSKTGCHQHMGYRKGMAIASLNVNGLRSHLDEVKILMTDLGIHILALNETKLAPDYPKELTNVAGYQQERLDRTCNGGGVSIYIRDSIKYKPWPDVPADDLEIICIEVEPPKSKSFLVLA